MWFSHLLLLAMICLSSLLLLSSSTFTFTIPLFILHVVETLPWMQDRWNWINFHLKAKTECVTLFRHTILPLPSNVDLVVVVRVKYANFTCTTSVAQSMSNYPKRIYLPMFKMILIRLDQQLESMFFSQQTTATTTKKFMKLFRSIASTPRDGINWRNYKETTYEINHSAKNVHIDREKAVLS